MTPDRSGQARRVQRGLARCVTGLALVAVVAACGSDGDSDRGARFSALTPLATPSVEQSEVPLEPTDSQAEVIRGSFRLRIPQIGVDAPVVPIESNEDRVLLPPRDPGIAGWWEDGAAPGAVEGAAVLVGHTVRNNGGGIFDAIGNLRSGDTIEVEGSDAALMYHVKSVDVLSKDELAQKAEQLFAQDGPGRLVVVTCDDWDGTAWRSNIVTIASLI